jgi:hypothetical protein
MVIIDMTDATTTTDIHDCNDSNAVTATPSAWPYSACSSRDVKHRLAPYDTIMRNEVTPMVKRLTTAAELEAAISAEMATKDPELREAFISLAREGRIVDTGQRRNGEIVWAATGWLPHR